MKRNVARTYWENRINTASAGELIVIAYEGAISNLEAAKAKFDGDKILDAGLLIIKAQKLIRELRNSLNMDVKEVSGNLFNLYRFMDRQLIEASRNQDSAAVDRVIGMLAGLKDAWAVAAKSVPVAQAQPANAPVFMSTYK